MPVPTTPVVKIYQTLRDNNFSITGTATYFNVYRNGSLLATTGGGIYSDVAPLIAATYVFKGVNASGEGVGATLRLAAPNDETGFSLVRPVSFNVAGSIGTRLMSFVDVLSDDGGYVKVLAPGVFEVTASSHVRVRQTNPSATYTPQVAIEGDTWVSMLKARGNTLPAMVAATQVGVGVKFVGATASVFKYVGGTQSIVASATVTKGDPYWVRFQITGSGSTVSAQVSATRDFASYVLNATNITGANSSKVMQVGYPFGTGATFRFWDMHYNKYDIPALVNGTVVQHILDSKTCGAGPRNLQDTQVALLQDSILIGVYVHNDEATHPNMDMDSCGYILVYDRETLEPKMGFWPVWSNPSRPSTMPVLARGRTRYEVFSNTNEWTNTGASNLVVAAIQRSTDGGMVFTNATYPTALNAGSYGVGNRMFSADDGTLILPMWTTNTTSQTGVTPIVPVYCPAGNNPISATGWLEPTTRGLANASDNTVTIEPSTPYQIGATITIESRNYCAAHEGADDPANRIVYTTSTDKENWSVQALRQGGLYDLNGTTVIDYPFRIGTGTIQCYYANGRVRALCNTTDGVANDDFPLRLIQRWPPSEHWRVVKVLDARTNVTYGAPDIDGDSNGEVAAWVPDGAVGELSVFYTSESGSAMTTSLFDTTAVVAAVPSGGAGWRYRLLKVA